MYDEALFYHKQSLQMRHILYNRSHIPAPRLINDMISSLTNLAGAYANHKKQDLNATARVIAYRSKFISLKSEGYNSLSSVESNNNINNNTSDTESLADWIEEKNY